MIDMLQELVMMRLQCDILQIAAIVFGLLGAMFACVLTSAAWDSDYSIILVPLIWLAYLGIEVTLIVSVYRTYAAMVNTAFGILRNNPDTIIDPEYLIKNGTKLVDELLKQVGGIK